MTKVAAFLAALAALLGACSGAATRAAVRWSEQHPTCPTYLPSDGDVHGTVQAIPMTGNCPTTTTGHG